MDDLVQFVNRDDVEPTVQAGLAHAQFELIHPYADGNGRLGRVLISWILARGLRLRVPPPVSVLLARDRTSYVSSLTGFREIGPGHWVQYFAEVVSEAARATDGLLTDVRLSWRPGRTRLADLRPMAAARRSVAARLPTIPWSPPSCSRASWGSRPGRPGRLSASCTAAESSSRISRGDSVGAVRPSCGSRPLWSDLVARWGPMRGE